MTALADLRSLRNVDQKLAATNALRTRGTDNLLDAAAVAGTSGAAARTAAITSSRSNPSTTTGSAPVSRN